MSGGQVSIDYADIKVKGECGTSQQYCIVKVHHLHDSQSIVMLRSNI